MNLVKGTYTKA